MEKTLQLRFIHLTVYIYTDITVKKLGSFKNLQNVYIKLQLYMYFIRTNSEGPMSKFYG